MKRRNRQARVRRVLRGMLLLLLLSCLCVIVPRWQRRVESTGNLLPDLVSDAGQGQNESYREEFADANGSLSIAAASPDSIPDYTGEDILILQENIPCFTYEELSRTTGEWYSELDGLGRCGAATAMLSAALFPQGERGEIGEVKPSGWHTQQYPDLIEDRYLYNRCHLIAWAMTGQNDNPQNLITGTRHLNKTLMLPYELQILSYVSGSDNHVLYRVTPCFRGNELVARGVELEAYSVEDDGAGICFHVFLYNVQPGIEIDYLTGESRAAPAA